MPAHRLHCVHLAGLGSRPHVLTQPGGEVGVVSLATDADIGRGEPGTQPRVLEAKQEVHTRRLSCDVLGDGDGGPGVWAGIGGGVLAVLAEGAVTSAAALEEAGEPTTEPPPLDDGHLCSEDQVPDVLGPGVGNQRGLWHVLPGVHVPGQQGPVALPQDGRHPWEPRVVWETEDRALVGGTGHLPEGHLS